MKILFLSSHEVLEWDEVSLLTDIPTTINPGFDVEVFSMGAFSNPLLDGGFMRTTIKKGRFYPELYEFAMKSDKDHIHPELVKWADLVVIMHNSKIQGQTSEQPWIVNNWKLFKETSTPVVWRSIGQSVPIIEKELLKYREEGLKIIRYSPLEKGIPNYCGEDAMIRFAKDPDEFNNWNGDRQQIITIAQSFKKRGDFLGYGLFDKITSGFSRKVYGTENANLPEDMNGGQRTYEELKKDIRDSRCFFYFGTQPAPYTLSLIEAMMTGIPIVAVGDKLRSSDSFRWKTYEIPDIIVNGINGFFSDDISELRGYVKMLLEDHNTAKRIGEAGRRTAIELFGKKERMNEWTSFLRNFL